MPIILQVIVLSTSLSVSCKLLPLGDLLSESKRDRSLSFHLDSPRSLPMLFKSLVLSLFVLQIGQSSEMETVERLENKVRILPVCHCYLHIINGISDANLWRSAVISSSHPKSSFISLRVTNFGLICMIPVSQD